MADFVFNLDEEVALTNKVGGGASVKTDVHAVTIGNVFLGKTTNGNNVVDFIFETESGGKGVIFGMCIDPKWASGAENFDYATWQEFAKIAGMKTGDTYEAKRKMNGKEVSATAFKEVAGKKLNLAIYEEFDFHNAKESSKLKLAQTFTPSGKSLVEAVSKLEPVQMEDVRGKLKDTYTKAWKKQNADGGIPKTEGAADTSTGDANVSADEDDDDLFD